MHLLIDENLSEALLAHLEGYFPGSLHVRQLGFGGASDLSIWNLAIEHSCVLLTRDEDFLQLSVLKGFPPKVILLRMGNCTNSAVVACLLAHVDAVRAGVSCAALMWRPCRAATSLDFAGRDDRLKDSAV